MQLLVLCILSLCLNEKYYISLCFYYKRVFVRRF